MCFCCSIYIETAQNSLEECYEFADLLFWRLSLCLSRDSLSCDTRSLNLCILFKFIFLLIPLIHSAPFLRFSHILLYTRNIFLIPVAWNLIILISAVKDLISTIFFFQTFIVLLQWNFPRNISANLLIFTNKVSSRVVIV